MEDIFLSFGFQLTVWVLLAFSAVGVLILYYLMRRRELRLDLAYTFQELVRLCDQKAEEQRQLERQIRDLDERKAERDRYQAEEARARQWLDSQASILHDIQEQNTKLSGLRAKYNEYEQAIAKLDTLHADIDQLQQQHDQMTAQRDKLSTDIKESSGVYLALSQELEQRKTQADQLSGIVADRDRQHRELKETTEEYMHVSDMLEKRRSELNDLDTELDQLRARADRFKMENPFLADHQERITQQWRTLEGQYQEVVHRNRQQWQTLEEQYKRLRDQAQRATTSLSL